MIMIIILIMTHDIYTPYLTTFTLSRVSMPFSMTFVSPHFCKEFHFIEAIGVSCRAIMGAKVSCFSTVVTSFKS